MVLTRLVHFLVFLGGQRTLNHNIAVTCQSKSTTVILKERLDIPIGQHGQSMCRRGHGSGRAELVR